MNLYILPIQTLYAFTLGVLVAHFTYRFVETFRRRRFIYIPAICECGVKEYSIIRRLPLLWYILNRGRCPECGERLNTGRFMYEIGVGLLFVFLYLTSGMGGQFYLKATVLSLILLISPPVEFKFHLNLKTLMVIGLATVVFAYSGYLNPARAIIGFLIVTLIYLFVEEERRYLVIPVLLCMFLGLSNLLIFAILYLLFIFLDRTDFEILRVEYIVLASLMTIVLRDLAGDYLMSLF